LFKLLRMGRRVTKKAVKEEFPKSKQFLRDFAERFPDVVAAYKKAALRAAAHGAGKPSDFEIDYLLSNTAHRQNLILIKEMHVDNINNITGNQGSIIALGNGSVTSSTASYQAGQDFASSLGELKTYIDEVAEGERTHFVNSLELLIRAIDDHTVPKAELVEAIEAVSKGSPGMLRRLKSLCGVATERASEILVKQAIEFTLGSPSQS
jgi:hypothetical protein